MEGRGGEGGEEGERAVGRERGRDGGRTLGVSGAEPPQSRLASAASPSSASSSVGLISAEASRSAERTPHLADREDFCPYRYRPWGGREVRPPTLKR